VWVGFLLLGEPVQRLTELYSGDYRLQGLGPWASAVLLGGGALLGLLGSWLSVGRHLAAIEPT
jgi:cell division transport system permease protein